MAAMYSLPLLLRQTPKPLLKRYFHSRGLLREVDFEYLTRASTDSILTALRALPDSARTRVEGDFCDLYALANPAGAKLIASELAVREIVADYDLGCMLNHYHRAMWFLLNHGDGPNSPFVCALYVARCRQTPGPHFRRRKNLPHRAPRTDPETLAHMAERLREFFGHEGRGRHCVVRHEPLADPPRHYFIAHTQDYADTRLEYDGEELRAVARHGVFDVVFAMLPESGVLEVRAPGDKAQVDALVRIFQEAALPDDPTDEGASGPADGSVRLNQLLDAGFSFPVDDDDGIETVEIMSLRVNKRGQALPRYTVKAHPTAPTAFLVELENGLKPALKDLEVNRAQLRVRFRGADGTVGQTVPVVLATPDTVHLKDDREHQIVRRCLQRWALTA